MKLIVGLGNPGEEYRKTRHNVGFDVVESFADRLGASGFKSKFKGEFLKATHSGKSCILLKPHTYMNLSGQSVVACMTFYKIPVEDIVIVSDDMDLVPGRARCRASGSAGGQKGLASIIECLGTNDFKRIRVGIGRPAGKRDVTSHVLGKWRGEDREMYEDVEAQIIDALTDFVSGKEFENVSFNSQQALSNATKEQTTK